MADNIKTIIETLPERGETLLKNNISQTEELLIKLKGSVGEAFVVTNKRLYILKWGFLAGNLVGGRCLAFEFHNVTSIEIKTSIISGTVEVITPGTQNAQKSSWNSSNNSAMNSDNIVTFPANERKLFQDAVNFTRNMIAESHHTPWPQATSDPYAELERLADLKNKGIVTEEEFQTKKRHLLGLSPESATAKTPASPLANKTKTSPVCEERSDQGKPAADNSTYELGDTEKGLSDAKECSSNATPSGKPNGPQEGKNVLVVISIILSFLMVVTVNHPGLTVVFLCLMSLLMIRTLWRLIRLMTLGWVICGSVLLLLLYSASAPSTTTESSSTKSASSGFYSYDLGPESPIYVSTIIKAALVPNKLGIDGSNFKTRINRKGSGIFVYDTKSERKPVWLVVDHVAYTLNGPSKLVTPNLKWPREADPDVWKKTGLDPFSATEALELIYGP